MYGTKFLFKDITIHQFYERTRRELLHEIDRMTANQLPRDTDEEEAFFKRRLPRIPTLGEIRCTGTVKGEGQNAWGDPVTIDFNAYEITFYDGTRELFFCNPMSNTNMSWSVTPRGEVDEHCLRFKAPAAENPDREVEQFKAGVERQLDSLRGDMPALEREVRQVLTATIRQARDRRPSSKY